MKKNEEEIVEDRSNDGDSGIHLPERQMKSDLNEFGKIQFSLENSEHRMQESSEILKSYLRSLESCARKRRHRNISQELGQEARR